MEYRYANEIGKPIIGFLHKDPKLLVANKCDMDKQDQDDLEKFRTFAKQKLCKFYETPQELGAVVSRSITQIKDSFPANGWVPAKLLEDAPSPSEILKLKKQIELLTAENYNLKKAIGNTHVDLAQANDQYHLDLLVFVPKESEDKDAPQKNEMLSVKVKTTWNEMFVAMWIGVPPSIKNTVAAYRLSELGARLIRDQGVILNFEFNVISNIRLPRGLEKTIALQFRALGLMTAASANDRFDDEIYSLTEAGLMQVLPQQAMKRSP